MSARSTTLLVGNIPYEASEDQMKEVFAQIGPVVNFKLLYDKESGKPKGYGICEYRDSELSLSAIRNLNGYEIKGKALRVDVTTSERSKEELKNLQISLGGPSGEDTRDSEMETEKAPETISKAVATLPPEQMFELMKQMKLCVQNNPGEARTLLLQNPQLAFALLQAQVVMRIVDPQVALNILNRPSPTSNASTSSSSTTEADPVKTTASAPVNVKAMATTSSGPSVPVSSSQVDTSPSNVPTSTLPSTTASAAAALPPATTSFSNGTRNSMPPSRLTHVSEGHVSAAPPEVSRQSVPPSRHHPQRDSFGPFGDPRNLADRDMRISSRGDLSDGRLSSRIDLDMRQPPAISLGDQDMRQPMGDHDFRFMRVPQMMDSRPFDPRLRAVSGGDTLGRPVASSAPFERGPHPFDPRTAHETRPSGPPARLEDPRTAMRSQTSSRTGSATSTTAALAQSLSGIGSSRPSRSVVDAANAIAPHDQEKAALIMQVLQLSDEQIAMLPPGQRQSILILKEQIARTRSTNS